jgi:hypothetical protein
MIYPGTSPPGNNFPKNGQESKRMESPGTKCLDDESLSDTQAVSKVGPAPTSRIYTRDYRKVGRDPDQTDLITSVLGNPFRL